MSKKLQHNRPAQSAGQQAEEIEKIQRRATKRVAVLRDLPY